MRGLLRYLALCLLVVVPFLACMDFGEDQESSGCEPMTYDLCLFGDCACSGVVCPDDGNPCTRNYCSGGRCVSSVSANGTACTYDGLEGVCVNGVCGENLCEDVWCDDEPCSRGECDYVDGLCDYTSSYPDGTECPYDGMDGICVSGICVENPCIDVVCDDDDACTLDSCDYADGACSHAEMEDGEPCTLDGLSGHCVSGVCIEGTGGTGGFGGTGGTGGTGGGAEPRRVFVTSQLVTGNALGGLAGADALCQSLADAAALGGTYMAWLSDDYESPSTRFTRSTGPYVHVNGRVVAENWDDLVDGSLATAIFLTEEARYRPETDPFCSGLGAYAYTGTNAAGEAEPPNCRNWGSGGPWVGAVLGLVNSPYQWSAQCWSSSSETCDGLALLYCFEQ